MIEKMKASKRKVAKRGGNVAKAPANKTPKRVPTPRGQDRDYWGNATGVKKGKLQAPTSMLNKKSKKQKATREAYGTTRENIEYNTKTKNRGSGAPKASTKGQPKSAAKKVPTKVATGVKRSMTVGDALGLRRAMNSKKMSKVVNEANSMLARRVNKATTRYKK
tara:strand:+ start:3592 stop:4083 length:492 start_codon:yes stop_codon:yes gene_type:complete